ALSALELELQRLDGTRPARNPDELHDLLRELGDLTVEEVAARVSEPAQAGAWLEALEAAHRAVRVRVHGDERWIAVEDAARYRDALGVAMPVGIPHVFLEPQGDPLGDLVGRYARTHG